MSRWGFKAMTEDKGWYKPGDGARKHHYFVIDIGRSRLEQYSLCDRWMESFPESSPQNTTHPDKLTDTVICLTCAREFVSVYGKEAQ